MPDVSPDAPFDALLLTGGRARRLGGADKASLVVGGRTLLDRVTAAVAGARTVVVVGPEHGGGPVAALAAGLERVTVDEVVVLPADLPFLTADAVAALRRALAAQPGAAVAFPLDPDGREQVLCAAWRSDALRNAIASVGDPAGASVRSLLDAAGPAVRVPHDGRSQPTPWFDCDTPADLAAAERWAQDGNL